MQNKYLKPLIIVLAVAIIVPQITLAAWWNPFSWGIWGKIWNSVFPKQEQQQEQLIGGDKDEHGCLIAAGYSWCEVKQKCLRTWEEVCEADETADWKTYEDTSNGVPFSFEYPSSWTYQKFSCNTDGVAFCLAKNNAIGCGQTCGMDSPSSPVYLYFHAGNPALDISDSLKYWSDPNVVLNLWDKTQQGVFQKMVSTFKFTK